jgi:hypothetical protein
MCSLILGRETGETEKGGGLQEEKEGSEDYKPWRW